MKAGSTARDNSCGPSLGSCRGTQTRKSLEDPGPQRTRRLDPYAEDRLCPLQATGSRIEVEGTGEGTRKALPSSL